mgnify:CR=1 FL=1
MLRGALMTVAATTDTCIELLNPLMSAYNVAPLIEILQQDSRKARELLRKYNVTLS